VKISYGVVHNHINGLVLSPQPATTTNIFVTLVGVAIIYFGVHILIGSQSEPVTIMDEELLKSEEGERNE
ncbi:MAG: hypothetical protein QW767_03650, partial [Thermoprotei archaeon]